MLVIGLVSFLGQQCVADNGLGEMRSIAWPVGTTSKALRLSDGRYAVPLDPLDRIQIYSTNLHFEYGWQVPASGGILYLRHRADQNLDVYVVRGDRHYVYDVAGHQLASDTYDFRHEPFTEHDTRALRVSIPYPWWAFPFRGPIYGWSFLFMGIMLLIATRSEVERRRGIFRKYHPRQHWNGPVGSATRTVRQWFGAAVWAGVGIVWFVAMLSALVECARSGNIVGFLILIPFFLIGCVLLLLAMKIIFVACRGLWHGTRKIVNAFGP